MSEQSKPDNEFGDQTYWNRPVQGRPKKLVSKYGFTLKSSTKPHVLTKSKTAKAEVTKPATKASTPVESPLRFFKTAQRSTSPVPATTRPRRSPSPTQSTTSSVDTVEYTVSPTRSAHTVAYKSAEEENDDKDEKSIVKIMKSKMPQFSNEVDWEMSIFELGLVLDRVWPHGDKLDIVEYMTSPNYQRSLTEDMETRADRLIYFALTTASKNDSFAKLHKMASCHRDAIPCVLKNEGKKLYQMFHTMFSMTNLHQASLPTIRAEFYAITQKEGESILKYTSRVDVIVATMAKLGERISPGAWIYALGNGLRAEFRECKDGILYTKEGFSSVMSVKTKLLSEEAVITSQLKRTPIAPLPTKTVSFADDEIALINTTKKNLKKLKISPAATTEDSTADTLASPDTALWLKGKGGKNDSKGNGNPKGKRWVAPDQQWNNSNDWTQWSQPPKGKGRGRGLWCDICNRASHSTEWGYLKDPRGMTPA